MCGSLFFFVLVIAHLQICVKPRTTLRVSLWFSHGRELVFSSGFPEITGAGSVPCTLIPSLRFSMAPAWNGPRGKISAGLQHYGSLGCAVSYSVIMRYTLLFFPLYKWENSGSGTLADCLRSYGWQVAGLRFSQFHWIQTLPSFLPNVYAECPCK